MAPDTPTTEGLTEYPLLVIGVARRAGTMRAAVVYGHRRKQRTVTPEQVPWAGKATRVWVEVGQAHRLVGSQSREKRSCAPTY